MQEKILDVEDFSLVVARLTFKEQGILLTALKDYWAKIIYTANDLKVVLSAFSLPHQKIVLDQISKIKNHWLEIISSVDFFEKFESLSKKIQTYRYILDVFMDDPDIRSNYKKKIRELRLAELSDAIRIAMPYAKNSWLWNAQNSAINDMNSRLKNNTLGTINYLIGFILCTNPTASENAMLKELVAKIGLPFFSPSEFYLKLVKNGTYPQPLYEVMLIATSIKSFVNHKTSKSRRKELGRKEEKFFLRKFATRAKNVMPFTTTDIDVMVKNHKERRLGQRNSYCIGRYEISADLLKIENSEFIDECILEELAKELGFPSSAFRLEKSTYQNMRRVYVYTEAVVEFLKDKTSKLIADQKSEVQIIYPSLQSISSSLSEHVPSLPDFIPDPNPDSDLDLDPHSVIAIPVFDPNIPNPYENKVDFDAYWKRRYRLEEEKKIEKLALEEAVEPDFIYTRIKPAFSPFCLPGGISPDSREAAVILAIIAAIPCEGESRYKQETYLTDILRDRTNRKHVNAYGFIGRVPRTGPIESMRKKIAKEIGFFPPTAFILDSSSRFPDYYTVRIDFDVIKRFLEKTPEEIDQQKKETSRLKELFCAIRNVRPQFGGNKTDLYREEEINLKVLKKEHKNGQLETYGKTSYFIGRYEISIADAINLERGAQKRQEVYERVLKDLSDKLGFPPSAFHLELSQKLTYRKIYLDTKALCAFLRGEAPQLISKIKAVMLNFEIGSSKYDRQQQSFKLIVERYHEKSLNKQKEYFLGIYKTSLEDGEKIDDDISNEIAAKMEEWIPASEIRVQQSEKNPSLYEVYITTYAIDEFLKNNPEAINGVLTNKRLKSVILPSLKPLYKRLKFVLMPSKLMQSMATRKPDQTTENSQLINFSISSMDDVIKFMGLYNPDQITAFFADEKNIEKFTKQFTRIEQLNLLVSTDQIAKFFSDEKNRKQFVAQFIDIDWLILFFSTADILTVVEITVFNGEMTENLGFFKFKNRKEYFPSHFEIFSAQNLKVDVRSDAENLKLECGDHYIRKLRALPTKIWQILGQNLLNSSNDFMTLIESTDRESSQLPSFIVDAMQACLPKIILTPDDFCPIMRHIDIFSHKGKIIFDALNDCWRTIIKSATDFDSVLNVFNFNPARKKFIFYAVADQLLEFMSEASDLELMQKQLQFLPTEKAILWYKILDRIRDWCLGSPGTAAIFSALNLDQRVIVFNALMDHVPFINALGYLAKVKALYLAKLISAINGAMAQFNKNKQDYSEQNESLEKMRKNYENDNLIQPGFYFIGRYRIPKGEDERVLGNLAKNLGLPHSAFQLKFSREQDLRRVYLDPNAIVEFLEKQIPEKVQEKFRLMPAIPAENLLKTNAPVNPQNERTTFFSQVEQQAQAGQGQNNFTTPLTITQNRFF